MAEFSILTGDGKEFIYELEKDDLSIGRSKDRDIILPDHTISRKHARMSKTPEGYLLEDLGSHNGTFVNASRITTHILRHNDQVKIGASMLTFLDESARAATPPVEESKPVVDEPEDLQEREVIESGPVAEEEDGQELLISIKSDGAAKEDEEIAPKFEGKESETSRINLIDLEKSNKTLYVLLQISRKLNTVPDFDELLSTIMDSIFQVIDADHGFVALLGDKPDELIPKVVKYRTAPDQSSQELRVSRTIASRRQSGGQ